MSGITNDQAIALALEAADGDRKEALWLLVNSFADLDGLADELKRNAMMKSLGMGTPSKADELVYGVLSIVRPELTGRVET